MYEKTKPLNLIMSKLERFKALIEKNEGLELSSDGKYLSFQLLNKPSLPPLRPMSLS